MKAVFVDTQCFVAFAEWRERVMVPDGDEFSIGAHHE